MIVSTATRLECVRGKASSYLDAADLAAQARGYAEALLDLGTGDGRYAWEMARAHPDWLTIGLDSCREGLRDRSRKAPPGGNALFVIANALALPPGLAGLATQVAVNFPWGSLLLGLLDGDPALLDGLRAVARPGAILECRLNGGALAEAGWALDDGAARVGHVVRDAGFVPAPPGPTRLDARALRACPTTWARRLAFGRDPHAIYLRAVRGGAPGGQA
jgi:16S rRNA (adenine(1408)-N(1))-methyltransferase